MGIHKDEIEQAFREGYIQGQKETAELKRLLRLATATIKLLNDKLDLAVDDTDCWKCDEHICNCAECFMMPLNGTCKRKHVDEAEKLLEEKK